MKYAAVFVLCLCGCSDGIEGPTVVEPPLYQPIVTGTLYDGRGGLAHPPRVNVAMLPLGCTGGAPVALSVTAFSGTYRAVLPERRDTAKVCIRVESDAWQSETYDNAVVFRDSVDLRKQVIVDVRYDFAVTIVSLTIGTNTLAAVPSDFDFDLVTGNEVRSFNGSAMDVTQSGRRLVTRVNPGTELTVRYGLNRGGGFAYGEEKIQIEADQSHWVMLYLQQKDPSIGCFCFVNKRIPVTLPGKATADTIFVMTGVLPLSSFVIS